MDRHYTFGISIQEGRAVAIMAQDDPSTNPAMFPSLVPACTATAMRGKLGSECETYLSYNGPMHFHHRLTDRHRRTLTS